jgi:hypothetical protein
MMSITRTETFANLSTGHLTLDVRTMLDGRKEVWCADLGISCMSREYGYWINVPTPEYAKNDLPQCLQDCFAAAREDGASWILFDRDEDPIEGLSYYEDGNIPILLAEAA